MVICKRDGTITHINRSFSRMVASEAGELIGRRLEDLIARPAPMPPLDPVSRMLIQGQVETALQRRSDTTPVTLEIVRVPGTGQGGAADEFLVQAVDLTIRRQTERSLRERAELDRLTGLPNRGGVERELARRQAEARRYGYPMAVVMIDLDGLKAVNDDLGHAAGDRLLTAVANAMRRRLRESDVLGRIGGDEFLALLPHTSLDEAVGVAEALIERVERCRAVEADRGATVSASAGVSALDPKATAPRAAVEAADSAMYAAKRAGGSAVETASPLAESR